ncbi:MAG: lysyl oxidase family protein [Polyangiaceae bacterium]
MRPHSTAFATCFALLFSTLIGCGDDAQTGAGGTGATAGAGGNGGSSSNTTGGGGTGGDPNPTCTTCPPAQPICVDGETCEEACPANRETCWTDPALAPGCCAAGQSCCKGVRPGTDFCADSASACAVTCPDGSTCSTDGFCQLDAATLAYTCATSCQPQAECGENLCCPLGARCVAGACELADLSIDRNRIQTSIDVEKQFFANDACEIQEGCIQAPGDRRLLRFDLKTPNLGDGDLFMGDPTASDLFVYSTCHNHYHFLGYASYELLDSNGQVVATGHKQAFCLLDFEEAGPNAGPGKYDCSFQGISAGWSDVYGAGLPCQWVDITDVPAGDYKLHVRVNYDHILAESSYNNNEALIPVTITQDACPGGCGPVDPTCCAPNDPCGWAANSTCDCNGFYEWDAAACSTCPSCTDMTTCPGGCTPPTDACCDPSNPCNLGTDGVCSCAGTQTWDQQDCSHCESADADCAGVVVDSCPNACTPNNNPMCCAANDPCGWASDGYCDCGGIDWDQQDCSSCACAP